MNHRDTEGTEDGRTWNELTGSVIGAALEVHRHLGPGIPHARQRELPICYKGIPIDVGLRIDLIVRDRVVVELKAVERQLPVHEAQLLTYLRLSGYRIGLLLNFNVVRLRDGITRMVL